MSKLMGPLPPGFAADADAMLLIGGRRADALVEEAGDTPLFVYDLALIDAKIARFRAAFAGIHLHYAMKANPYLPLLEHVGRNVQGVDLASGGELRIALEAGLDPEAMSFAGPGKRDADLGEAIAAGVTLNCESEGEAERALIIAARLGRTPRLAVRVNPDFEIKGSGMRMGGGAKPFGVDAARVPALVRRIREAGADWRGFHIFAGSQALDPDALIEAQAATLALAAELSQAAGAAPPLVNLGGGFGIPHFHGEQALDVEKVGVALGEGLAARAEILRDTLFAIELGRWIVGECGVYLTRIVDRKVSHGKTFLVCDGGMQHQLAASGNFGQIVRRNYPAAIAGRFGAAPEEEVSIVGCLCTPLDRLADDVMMPRADVGDLVAVFATGAYGLSASPRDFLGHPPAREIAVSEGN
ncbi:MAG TPA: pyridoxal-dependent decarboxylase, exosortase A system-associated [Allosphingosinicella sp.]|nr:pyridoxal-dependent decarboxylase, exosortase A system-associated [Allosphingosinicella sp.]